MAKDKQKETQTKRWYSTMRWMDRQVDVGARLHSMRAEHLQHAFLLA